MGPWRGDEDKTCSTQQTNSSLITLSGQHFGSSKGSQNVHLNQLFWCKFTSLFLSQKLDSVPNDLFENYQDFHKTSEPRFEQPKHFSLNLFQFIIIFSTKNVFFMKKSTSYSISHFYYVFGVFYVVLLSFAVVLVFTTNNGF